ncbi:MAG: proprotein convertase P-domain-containing protein [Myxococcales bacterium]|nr:proprotein convertase P-domain-containing protein [Myxococcales bacterium]
MEDDARPTRGPWIILPPAWQACRGLTVTVIPPAQDERAMRPAPELAEGAWVLDLADGPQPSAAGEWLATFSGDCLANEAPGRQLELTIDNRFALQHPELVLTGADERLLPFTPTPGALEPRVTLGVDAALTTVVRDDTLAVADVDPDQVHWVSYTARDGEEPATGHLTVWRPRVLQSFPGPHLLHAARATRLGFAVEDEGETSMALVCVATPEPPPAWPDVQLTAPDGRMARASATHWRRGNEQRWCADLSAEMMRAELSGRWSVEVRAAPDTEWTAQAIEVAVGQPLGVVPPRVQYCIANQPCEVRFEFVNSDGQTRGEPVDFPDFGAIEGGIGGTARDPGMLTIPVVLRDGSGQSRLAEVRFPNLNGLANALAPRAIPDLGEATLVVRPPINGHFSGGMFRYQIMHPNPCQLRVSLTGPDGTRVMLRDRECDGQTRDVHDFVLGDDPRVTPLLGKPLAGDWTLTVRDMGVGQVGHALLFEMGWMQTPAVITGELSPAVVGERFGANIEYLGFSGPVQCHLVRGSLAPGLALNGCRIEGQVDDLSATSAIEIEVYDAAQDERARRNVSTPTFHRLYPAVILNGILDPHSEVDFPVDAILSAGERLFVGLDLDADRLEDVQLRLCVDDRCLPLIAAFGPPGHRLYGWFGLDLVADTPVVVPPGLEPGEREWRLRVTNAGAGRMTLRRFGLGVREAYRILDHDLPAASLGNGYDHQLRTAGAPGGDVQVIWQLIEGRLPLGVNLGLDGKLAGRAREGGVFPITVQATALLGEQITADFALRVVVHEANANTGWPIPDGPEDPFSLPEGALLARCLDDVAALRADASCAYVPLDVPEPLDGRALQIGIDWEHASPADVDLYLLTPQGDPLLLRSGGSLEAASMSDTFCNEYSVRSELRGALREEEWEDAVDIVLVSRGQRAPEPGIIEACGALREAALADRVGSDPLFWNDCCAWFTEPLVQAGTAQGRWYLLAIDTLPEAVGRIHRARLSVFADNPAFFNFDP